MTCAGDLELRLELDGSLIRSRDGLWLVNGLYLVRIEGVPCDVNCPKQQESGDAYDLSAHRALRLEVDN